MASPMRQTSFRSISSDVNPSEAPEGLVRDALNVAFRKPGIAEPREGLFGGDPSDYSGVSAIQRMVHYDGHPILLRPGNVWIANKAAADAELTIFGSAINTYLNLHTGYLDTAQFGGNLYLCSPNGLLKITSGTDTVLERAGQDIGQQTLYGLAMDPTDDLTWLPFNSIVGYRITVRYRDANGVVTRSRPTEMLYRVNLTGGDASPVLSFALVSGFEAIEVWRTRSYAGTVTPAQTYLAFEFGPDAGLVHVDRTTDDNLGARMPFDDLEVLPDSPYAAKAVESYASSLFVGNIVSQQYQRLALKDGSGIAGAFSNTTCSVTNGSPNFTISSINSSPDGGGIAVGQIIDSPLFPVNTQVSSYSHPNVTADENATGTDAAASVDFNEVISIFDGTTEDIYPVRYIEPQTFGGELEVVAENSLRPYVSTTQFQFTGNIIIREVVTMAARKTWSIRATNGDSLYQESIPEWAETRKNFDQDVEVALLLWSLRDQPEVFTPGYGQVFVGDRGKAIWALASRGDRLFILKQDGVFVLEGEGEPNFRLDKISSDHIIMTPRHVCVTEIGVAVWTLAGIVILGDDGSIFNISSQRLDEWLGRFESPSDDPTELGGQMFYDQSRHELHVLIENGQDNSGDADYQYMHLVWNSQTRAWSRWALKWPALAGCSPGFSDSNKAFYTDPDQDGTSARVWYDIRGGITSYSELEFGDRLEELETAVFNCSSLGNNLFRFDYASFTDATLLAVGDTVCFNTPIAKLLVTNVEDLGGGSYRVTGFSQNVFTGNLLCRPLYAYESTIRLHAQKGPGLGHGMWGAAKWKLLRGTRLYKATVGVRSSDDPDDMSDTPNSGAFVMASASGHVTWTPRYLFDREHASAQQVEPFFTVREAGAYWLLSEESTSREDGGEELERYG